MAEIITMGELLVEIMRPNEDIPLYKTDYFRGPFPSGAPGIFISTAARLGHSTAMIGGVGKDDFGDTVLRRLKKDGVNVDRVLISAKGNTGIAFVTYFADGERKFLFYMDNSPCVMAKAPDSLKGLEDARFMHVCGCSLMASENFAEEIMKTVDMMKTQGTKISFDPNVRLEMMRDPSVMQTVKKMSEQAEILLPGVSELKMLTGKENLEDAVEKAFESSALEIIALKKGAKGCAVYTRKGLEVEQESYPVIQRDATGAGDCFDAAFVCGIAEGKTLKEAAQMGAAAGALNAAAFGPMEGDITQVTIMELIEKNISK